MFHLFNKAQQQVAHHKAMFDKVLVGNIVKPFAKNLFNAMGYIGIGCLLGGFDRCGEHLYDISPDGYYQKKPFTSEGSGSTFATPFLMSRYRHDMTVIF